MENRIKEQMCLFADRLSTDEIKGNQLLRLYFFALAYTLMEALRRLGLKGTAWAEAQVDTIRLKLLKIGAIVRIRVRCVLLQLTSVYPWKSMPTPSTPCAVDKPDLSKTLLRSIEIITGRAMRQIRAQTSNLTAPGPISP